MGTVEGSTRFIFPAGTLWNEANPDSIFITDFSFRLETTAKGRLGARVSCITGAMWQEPLKLHLKKNLLPSFFSLTAKMTTTARALDSNCCGKRKFYPVLWWKLREWTCSQPQYLLSTSPQHLRTQELTMLEFTVNSNSYLSNSFPPMKCFTFEAPSHSLIVHALNCICKSTFLLSTNTCN